MHGPASPPSVHEIAHLTASDRTGALVFASTASATALGLWLSAQPGWLLWSMGQLLLGAALVQWFIVLHECGHRTLFRRRRPNIWAGRVAGFFSIIPYHVWARVHGRHHKWTGWQDVDPTTATLVPRPLARWERIVVNVCWRGWVPIFSVLYRLNNFWNLLRLRMLFPEDERRAISWSALSLAGAYVAMAIVIGPALLVRLFGVANVLAFIVEDVLLISQHTHIPMTRSGGQPVPPYPPLDQERFTRSMRLPRVLSRLALHFDAHELHHMFPAVPGYRLEEIGYVAAHEVPVGTWVPAARAVPGAVLLFQSRNESGFDL